jgi:hypothetical protein
MAQVLDVFHEHCGGVIERFIPLSALEAQRGMAAKDPDRIRASNIGELRQVIEEEIAGRTEKIKQERLATTVAHYAGLGKATERYLYNVFSIHRAGLKPLRERLDLMEQEAVDFAVTDHTSHLDSIQKPW